MYDPDIEFLNLIRPDRNAMGILNVLAQQRQSELDLMRQLIVCKLKDEGMSDFDVQMWFLDREREMKQRREQR